jgi:hypothetical protein
MQAAIPFSFRSSAPAWAVRRTKLIPNEVIKRELLEQSTGLLATAFAFTAVGSLYQSVNPSGAFPVSQVVSERNFYFIHPL